MATAEQIKSLIKSHFSDQQEQFCTIALQLAAHEARQGHQSLANDIKTLVDQSATKRAKVISFVPELDQYVLTSMPDVLFSEMVQPHEIRVRIKRILLEYRQRTKLEKHGLSPRRKILIAGPPGTGKTLTASVLASELNLPLNTVLMDKVITKFMGETSAKLRQIFDGIKIQRAVYFFDEFDAIGGERGSENDVGEMRRVLNTFLQLLEEDRSESLIVAATNSPRMLDQALFRRFDDVMYYHLPSDAEIQQLIRNRLGCMISDTFVMNDAISAADSLSHAEIVQACDDAMKDCILSDNASVSSDLLIQMLKEKHDVYQGMKEQING
jgi:SpoVK/Ycf46/Vps4 family AAA+-type ATPase